MSETKKDTGYVKITLIIATVILILYFTGFFDCYFEKEVEEELTSGYSLKTDSIVLEFRGKDPKVSKLIGVSTNRIDEGERTWLADFERDGKYLKPECIFSTIVYNPTTGQETSAQIIGAAKIIDGKLDCDIGYYEVFGDRFNEYYRDPRIQWDFIQEEYTNIGATPNQ